RHRVAALGGRVVRHRRRAQRRRRAGSRDNVTEKGSLIVRRAEELRLLADPKKLRIFEALREGPASAHELALRFGEKPTALYHHFARLERAGFIEVVEKRQRRGVVEKRYGAAVKQIVVDRSLVKRSSGARSVQAVLAAASAIVRITIED